MNHYDTFCIASTGVLLVNIAVPSAGFWLPFPVLKSRLLIFNVCTTPLSISIPFCFDDMFCPKSVWLLVPCLVLSGEVCVRVGLLVDFVGKKSDSCDNCELSSQTLVSEIVNGDSS